MTITITKNKNIEKFIDEISPIIDIIQKENSYAAIVGDFNITYCKWMNGKNMPNF